METGPFFEVATFVADDVRQLHTADVVGLARRDLLILQHRFQQGAGNVQQLGRLPLRQFEVERQNGDAPPALRNRSAVTSSRDASPARNFPRRTKARH